ncbi:hypothetical protein [Marisediminitalea sp.]|uniref:hypothetical protein n=1 Tax=Marisediminitalea sp. TaxID=2662268 RepID=UPI00351655FD
MGHIEILPMYPSEKVLRKPPFESDRKDIEKLIYEKHWSDIQIADHYGVAKDTIWSRRMLWNLPSGSSLREAKLKEDITELWKAGYDVNETADVLEISPQMVYTKMRQYNIRNIPRMGIDAPELSLTELRQTINTDNFDDSATVVVTHNRQPKWVLMPVEDYNDLRSGMYEQLRQES